MTKYLLDTCVIVDLLRRKSKIDPTLFEKGSSINTITLSELYYGANKSNNSIKSIKQVDDLISDFDLNVINFDKKSSEVYGNLKANLETKGQKLDDMDLLIASTAIAQNMVLVTNNIRHFNRIKSLEIISPSIEN